MIFAAQDSLRKTKNKNPSTQGFCAQLAFLLALPQDITEEVELLNLIQAVSQAGTFPISTAHAWLRSEQQPSDISALQ